MEKTIDAVKLMRDIRLKLVERYLGSRKAELEELEKKFGHLKTPKTQDSIPPQSRG